MSDLRKVHWSEIASQDWLTDLRLRCYEYLLRVDATPDEVARALEVDILTVRPRCSELRSGLPRDAANPLVLAEATGERRDNAHVLRAIPYSVALERWRDRERNPCPASAPEAAEYSPPVITGFPTVEAAVNSLPLADRAALGARLMAKYGSLLKRHESNRSDQLTLLPT